uniref:Uncharacterized protein n=1 Tax=Arundo donax TaxID=35708 RepID=A0A0A9B4Q3_ARUDO
MLPQGSSQVYKLGMTQSTIVSIIDACSPPYYDQTSTDTLRSFHYNR